MSIIKYTALRDDELCELCYEFERLIVELGGANKLHPHFFSESGKPLKELQRLPIPTDITSQDEILTYLLNRLKILEYNLKILGQRFVSKSRTTNNAAGEGDIEDDKQLYNKIIEKCGMVLGEFAALSEVIDDRDSKKISINGKTYSFNELLKLMPFKLGITQRSKETKLDRFAFLRIPENFVTEETKDILANAINSSYSELLSFLKKTNFTLDSVTATQQFINNGIKDEATLKAFLEHYYNRSFSAQEEVPTQKKVAPEAEPKPTQSDKKDWFARLFGSSTKQSPLPPEPKPIKLGLSPRIWKFLSSISYTSSILGKNFYYDTDQREVLINTCRSYEEIIAGIIGQKELETICREKAIALIGEPTPQEEVPEQPNLSQVQRNATNYVINRLNDLERELREFLPLIEGCSHLDFDSKCRLYEQAVSISGKVLAEFAILAEVIQTKDIENISLGFNKVSLQRILMQMPYTLNFTSLPKQQGVRYNSVAGDLYPLKMFKSCSLAKYAKTQDSLFKGVTDSWVKALADLHKMGFIVFRTELNGRQIDPNRQGGSCIKTPINAEHSFAAFLILYFGSTFDYSYKYYNVELETWCFNYAQPHREVSMLPTEGNSVVANIAELIEPFGEAVLSLYSDIYSLAEQRARSS